MKLIPVPDGWQDEALIASFASASEIESLLDAFAPAELAIVRTFSSAKRRFEWIACRYTAKQLAMRRGDCALPTDAIVPSQNERPMLAIAGQARHFVSLSHSGSYGSAAVARKPVGIDVQVVRRIATRAARLFLSEDEAEALERCQVDESLLHFWCAKEAEWKRRSEFHATLRQTPLRLDQSDSNGLLFRATDGGTVETRRLGADLIAALAR